MFYLGKNGLHNPLPGARAVIIVHTEAIDAMEGPRDRDPIQTSGAPERPSPSQAPPFVYGRQAGMGACWRRRIVCTVK